MADRETKEILAHVPPFDDSVVYDEYRHVMVHYQEEQRQLYAEFKAFADDALAWSKAAAQFDNMRSRKRLKTRLEWVRAKQGEIEGVRAEVVSCIDAVRSAIMILGSASLGDEPAE
ncbi:uncharacterized protein V1510DRAFT_429217 [Dipodascopsis tothii]|uniref:uncharacterized protein n=1 Tax=Dipodascopsis tothii TaxID=44089 RepID=UPI0034CD8A9C